MAEKKGLLLIIWRKVSIIVWTMFQPIVGSQPFSLVDREAWPYMMNPTELP
jgi:hypothetical protein